MTPKYVIGLDFGTDSVRALVVNAHTGVEVGSAVHNYTRWQDKLYCDAAANQFRQHPLDYLEAMENCIRKAVSELPQDIINNITGISVDTTGSTVVPVDKAGTPLALLPEFANNPNAMFVLWKDHTAQKEADEINKLSHIWPVDYTKYCGGLYSPEWFWAKVLYILRTDTSVRQHAYSWVEHCDWIPAILTGNTNPLALKRGRCAAGHKAMWHEDFYGLPAEDFLQALDPLLSGLRERLYSNTQTADEAAGTISSSWAEKLGLPENIIIGVGSIDAHVGAVGACIEPYTMVKVTGTSTCDMVIVPYEEHKDHVVDGICGQVNGSIVPGMLGLEAGQSAFGDLYNWFVQLLCFPLTEIAPDHLSKETIDLITSQVLTRLNEKAFGLPVTVDDPVAIDWINGRRTPDVNLALKSAITGLSLGTDSASIFKSLVEATAFGSKAIMERFEQEGIPINKIVAIGGISKKSDFVMQTLSTVLNRSISVVRSEQTCALGAAMFAATVSGIYKDIKDAQEKMSSGYEKEYTPEPWKAAVYEKLYDHYTMLGKIISNEDVKVLK
jgi:L-ribulokinase